MIHSLFYHFVPKYIWNLIETLFALWEALSEAVNGREDLARRLLSYTYMCHQHDLSALGANVGCCWGDLLGQNVKVSKKSVVKCCPREGERAASKGTEQKAAPFFSPDPHWDSGTQQQKKHSKENDKMWCKSFEEIFVWKMSLNLTKHVCCVSLWRRLEETHSWYKRTMWEKSTKIPMFRSIAQRNIKSYLTKLLNRLCFMDFGSVLCCSYLTDKEYGNYWYFLASLLRIP